MRRALPLALVLLGALASSAATSDPVPHKFAIPQHGTLLLRIPDGWRIASNPIETGPAVGIVLRPATGDAFSFQISSVWIDPSRPGREPALSPAELREGVRRAAEQMLPKAVEKEAKVVELKGKDATGYYFSVTDKESTGAGADYKYLTQGILITGPVFSTFTFLHQDSATRSKEDALKVLRSASYLEARSGGAEPDASSAVTLQTERTDRGYRLTVPASALVLTIPGRGLSPGPAGTGAAASPRYFRFSDGERKLEVSGWFESDDHYVGLKKFWEQETAAWRKQGLPEPRNVVFTKIGGWDTIQYDIPAGTGTSCHVRAHWVDAGTWIDLHASTSSDRPASDSRDTLIAFLKTLEVSRK